MFNYHIETRVLYFISHFVIFFFSVQLIVINEPSARRHFSGMSALFEARATKVRVLHLRECAEYAFTH
jgi:hypothetical protein